MLRLIALTTIVMMTSGCTSTRGRAYTADGAGTLPPLGKVLIMPVRAPEVGDRLDDPDEQTDVACLVREALARAGATGFVEPPASADARRAMVSDYDAVLAARDAGADTVCLLTVGELQQTFWITVFLPTFGGRSGTLYSLRLVDAKTGKLLLDAVRSRSTGGTFVVRGEGSAARDLKNDLAFVLPDRSDPGKGID